MAIDRYPQTLLLDSSMNLSPSRFKFGKLVALQALIEFFAKGISGKVYKYTLAV